MKTNPTGSALKVVNYIATSTFIDKVGMRKPLEKMVYTSTKAGYKVMGKMSQQFKAAPDDKDQLSDEEKAQKKSNLFDLSYSEEQLMMAESLQKFARNTVRDQAHDADANEQLDENVHQAFTELGINYFVTPESFGGAANEHAPTTQMLIHQTLAYGDLGVSCALLSTIGVINAISRWGSVSQQHRYLPHFLEADESTSGSDSASSGLEYNIKAALAVQEDGVLFDPQKLKTDAKKGIKGYVINGQKSLVPLAEYADLFLVAARISEKKNGLFIVPKDTAGLTVKTASSMGLKSASTSRLILKNVKVKANALLGEGKKQSVTMHSIDATADINKSKSKKKKDKSSAPFEKLFSYQEFLDYSRLAWCAMAVGTCEAVRDYVISYCNEREAFGEVISHRQSVAFKIADMATEIEAMKVLTQRAVSLAERNESFKREAYLAKLLCGEKAMQIGTDGVQLLGGHGFTKEHPVERWYRDLRAIALVEGGLHL